MKFNPKEIEGLFEMLGNGTMRVEAGYAALTITFWGGNEAGEFMKEMWKDGIKSIYVYSDGCRLIDFDSVNGEQLTFRNPNGSGIEVSFNPEVEEEEEHELSPDDFGRDEDEDMWF